MARIEIGKHLAADTRVCCGRLIFKGTRILVSDALELTKAGYTPERIARQYRGMITAKGVREALALTRRGIVREIVARTRTAAWSFWTTTSLKTRRKSFAAAEFTFGKSGLKWGGPSGMINKRFFGFCMRVSR
jgi:uncharacterized protein (DUF433 family)